MLEFLTDLSTNCSSGASEGRPPVSSRLEATSFCRWVCQVFRHHSVAMWPCGSVALWLCVFVALWLCGFLAMWLCDPCENILLHAPGQKRNCNIMSDLKNWFGYILCNSFVLYVFRFVLCLFAVCCSLCAVVLCSNLFANWSWLAQQNGPRVSAQSVCISCEPGLR